MTEKKGYFEVLPAEEMRKKYYLPDEQALQLQLNPELVPISLRALIPLAEKWGISDDLLRADKLRKSSPDEIAELKRIIAEYDDLFDAWLAGPEAQSRTPSAEYLALDRK